VGNIFERGNDWLNSRLKTGGSSTVTLTDLGGNTGELSATIDKQVRSSKPVDDIDTQTSDKDFSILRSDLEVVDIGEPAIDWTVTYGGLTYRIFDVDESDAFRGRIMLRTLRVDE
jgi:hypothetical protein